MKNKKRFLLSTCVKVCFYLRAILPSCAVLQYQQLRTYCWNKQNLSRFKHKASNNQLWFFQKRALSGFHCNTKSLGVPVVLEDISPDCLSISSLTKWPRARLIILICHHFPQAKHSEGSLLSQEGNSKWTHKNKINFLDLNIWCLNIASYSYFTK